MIEDAEKRKAEKIQKAKERAVRMVDEAEAKTKQIREEAVKKALSDAEKDRSRRLLEAVAAAKRVRKLELGPSRVKGIADKVIKQIFG